MNIGSISNPPQSPLYAVPAFFAIFRFLPWLSRYDYGDSNVTRSDAVVAALQRNATAAIVNISRVIAPRSYHFVIAVWRAKEHNPSRKLLGYHRWHSRQSEDEARARTAFEAARAQQEKIVQAQPNYGPALCVLGLIDAALGRKDLALDEGRRAIALTPVEKDINSGSRVLQYFAITAAWAGDKELALQQLEAGLRAPDASSMLSYGALKLFPVWDPLRGDPRFEKIVESLAPKNP
jgi:tetratricopeptide (TPR) repeat protein